MKIVTVLGARPQFIKAGSVSREVEKRRNRGATISETIVHTGQHYDPNMSDIFFNELRIPKPHYSLGVGGSSHGVMTGRMIEKIEELLLNEQPDWVLLYGDTNSTLAGAIAASKLGMRIAHVEAGLRSHNMRMPEEVNRILTDRLSSVLFCPTSLAVDNLQREGVNFWSGDVDVIFSGDVMYDGALFYKDFSRKPSGIKVQPKYVLCTIHRAENTDSEDRLREIFAALGEIAERTQVVLPLHPRTKSKLKEYKIDVSNITVIEPQGYLNMVWLIENASLILTDSGGLQKEAYFFSVPALTLRDETEWQELVEVGANTLVGARRESILKAFEGYVRGFDVTLDLYGSGESSKVIVDYLLTNKVSRKK